jgi:hypothetical protein
VIKAVTGPEAATAGISDGPLPRATRPRVVGAEWEQVAFHLVVCGS